MTQTVKPAGSLGMAKGSAPMGMMRRYRSEQGDPFSTDLARILDNWPKNGTVDVGMGILIFLLDRTAKRQPTRLSDLRRLMADQAGLDEAITILRRLGGVRFLPNPESSDREEEILVTVTDNDLIAAWQDEPACSHSC